MAAIGFGFLRSRRQPSPPRPQAAAVTRVQAQPAEPPSVISDLALLRSMRYEPLSRFGLQAHEPYFALLASPSGFAGLLDAQMAGRPVAFEIAAALARAGLLIERRLATSEVIRALHEANRAQQQNAEIEPSELERLAADMIEAAAARGASDIHMEVREHGADVFYRIYGHRIRAMSLSRETATALAGMLYDIKADHGAKRDVKWSADAPIDAVIQHQTRSGARLQIRFATAPIYPRGCFQMVCRLLSMDPKAAPAFAELGYTAQQSTQIEEMLIGAQGLVLLVGPTNSGKSTTMQALAKRILEVRGPTIKIESIEDPVEYLIEGASQMPVSLKADFAELLKSTLRHDPDVLMVGEIRDQESADSIKNIVLAGRKVLATLHAYEALAAFQRLLNIGVPPDVLYMSGFISGVIYQRLLPRLCEHCAIPIEQALRTGMLPDALVQRLSRAVALDGSGARVHNPQGCPHCKSKVPGYSGRVVCAEIVRPDEAMLDALREDRLHDARAQWLRSECDTGYGPTALGHALMLLEQGLVDARDVESQVGIIRASALHESSAQAAVVGLAPRVRVREVAMEAAAAPDADLMDMLYERAA